MSMISCVICNGRIAFDADPCPKCGTKDPSGWKKKKLFYSRLIGLAVLIGVGVYIWLVEWPQLQHILMK